MIVGTGALAVEGLAVAGVPAQVTRLGLSLPGVAVTLAALAAAWILVAVWRGRRHGSPEASQ